MYGEYTSATTEMEGAPVGPKFPHLRRLAFEACDFEENDVLPLHKLLRANPTIEDIYTEGCTNNCIVIFAVLGSFDERGMAIMTPELEALGLSRERPEIPQHVVPHLKEISFFRRDFRYGAETDNQAYTFGQVLSQWESLHIYVDDWESYGGTKADTRILTTLFKERFCSQGAYPYDIGFAPSDSDAGLNDEEQN